MKERPILFSSPMVKALLAGTKTQTRRLATHRHGIGFLGGKDQEDDASAWGYAFDGPEHHGYAVLARGFRDRHDHGFVSIPCPYGEPGDRLWVRENFTSGYGRGCWGTIFQADGAFVQGKRQHPKGIHYNAADRPPGMKWRPSIHLPRWASRITLEVTSVRVERLQSISEEDALAEGISAVPFYPDDGFPLSTGYMLGENDGSSPLHTTAVKAFAAAWDGINGERASWASNPWLWCVSFRRLP